MSKNNREFLKQNMFAYTAISQQCVIRNNKGSASADGSTLEVSV